MGSRGEGGLARGGNKGQRDSTDPTGVSEASQKGGDNKVTRIN